MFILAFTIACLYVSPMKFIRFLPRRSYKVLDLFVNSAGAAFGAFAFITSSEFKISFSRGFKKVLGLPQDKAANIPSTKTTKKLIPF